MLCHCGRRFRSEAALLQHQADKHRDPDSSTPSNSVGLETKPPTRRAATRTTGSYRDARMWKSLNRQEPVHIIDATALEPSVAPVSSATPCELICSYNWQNPKGFQVPGHAPIWQDLTLPQTIPKDPRKAPADKPTFQFSGFQQVLQATALMRPEFRFNNVDIIVTRNSLRKLLDFCGGRALQSFRVNLSKVHDTLFIEQYDTINMASQRTGWGHNFERAFTRFPPGLEASIAHDRFLRYPIGDLNCVVGFEIDACYEQKSDKAERGGQEPFETLQTDMDKLALEAQVPAEKEILEASALNPPSQISKAKIMPQSTAAEIKSKAKRTGINAFLPQVWFGRTPWLIMGTHIEGTFHEIKITNAAAHFERWETEHQVELRKLATVLAELREAVRANGDQRCAAVYEKDPGSRVIRVFPMADGKVALSEEVVRQFWD